MQNEKIIVRSAYFTDHKTKQTAVAIEIDSSQIEGTSIFQAEEKYGKLWLESLYKLLLIIQREFTGNIHLVLVSGQPECVTLAKKVERIFCKMLSSKKQMTLEQIHKMVASDGNHRNHPNDEQYTQVLALLWQCKQTFPHFALEQHEKPSPAAARVFNAARTAVTTKIPPL